MSRVARYSLIAGLLAALVLIGRTAWWPIYRGVCFEETESGELSNGWPYTLRLHRFSGEPRFLLHVTPPGTDRIELLARRVNIEPQTNGKDAIQYLVGDKWWESDVMEWREFARSPGLWNEDDR